MRWQWWTNMTLLLLHVKPGALLRCYDGNCGSDLKSCNTCEGVGCVRTTRHESKEFGSITLTCLPPGVSGEPEGCKRSHNNDGQFCICYSSDYCNVGNHLCSHLILILLLLVLWRFASA